MEVTYTLPPLPNSLQEDLPPRGSEHDYIRSLFNPTAISYNAALPMELNIERELSNPHSRAKKQARWKAREVENKKLLEEFIEREYRSLKGRTKREARADASWKWREFVANEARETKMKKMKNRGTEARRERKKFRKARKAARQRQILNEMVLPAGKNQFIPPGTQPPQDVTSP